MELIICRSGAMGDGMHRLIPCAGLVDLMDRDFDFVSSVRRDDQEPL
jgi:hypothetical protein